LDWIDRCAVGPGSAEKWIEAEAASRPPVFFLSVLALAALGSSGQEKAPLLCSEA